MQNSAAAPAVDRREAWAEPPRLKSNVGERSKASDKQIQSVKHAVVQLGGVGVVYGTPQFGVYCGLTSITCQVLGRLDLSCSTFKEIMLL